METFSNVLMFQYPVVVFFIIVEPYKKKETIEITEENGKTKLKQIK